MHFDFIISIITALTSPTVNSKNQYYYKQIIYKTIHCFIAHHQHQRALSYLDLTQLPPDSHHEISLLGVILYSWNTNRILSRKRTMALSRNKDGLRQAYRVTVRFYLISI